MPRILFVCRERLAAYGNSIGLLNSAQFLVNYLTKHYNIEAKAVSVVDSNRIDKEVHDYKPTHVIIHALWVPTYKLKELITKYKKIKWIIRIHSKIPFLANEGIALEWLKEYSQLNASNLIISANSIDATDCLNAVGIKTTFLPNIYCPSHKPAHQISKHNPNVVNIGCFGAIRPLKNHLIQAMAAIAFGNKYNVKVNFYINAARTEQKGEQVLKNLRALFAQTRHQLIEVPWQDHETFLSTVATMDYGMQVSLTETFNIVTADFVYCNIPIVVSTEIDWMPWLSQANPHLIDSIVTTLEFNMLLRPLIRWWNRIALRVSNKKAGSIWSHFFT